jgi:small glutamine-rich tetratricopeptide repeat-containing protein alpha
VAVQCLEAAFGLTDANYAFQPSKPLVEIFRSAEGLADVRCLSSNKTAANCVCLQGESELPEPTEADKEQANKLKEEGNELMKSNQPDRAVQKYNEAIKLNRDPVYFCNRYVLLLQSETRQLDQT